MSFEANSDVPPRSLSGAGGISGLTSTLEGLLAELQALEIIYRQGLLPEPAYIFKHAVTQEVAYESMPFTFRSALHERVGGFIEQSEADAIDRNLDLLAHQP